MTTVRTDVRPDEVRHDARHTLFVEGSGPDAIDPTVLGELLRDTTIKIEALGASLNVKGASEALHAYHPDYYFLIDRDHRDHQTVETSWLNFPDSKTYNLLIWRRRELENYFIIPEYLVKSKFIACSTDELNACILQTVQGRIFLDAANLIIIQLRERLKEKWITLFERNEGFETREGALQQLIGRKEFSVKRRRDAQLFRKDMISNNFEKLLNEILGGQSKPAFGHGAWLEMVKGKKVLPTVVNQCFQVKNTMGRTIQGKEAVKAVVKELLRKPLQEQPNDFQELHNLINNKVLEK